MQTFRGEIGTVDELSAFLVASSYFAATRQAVCGFLKEAVELEGTSCFLNPAFLKDSAYVDTCTESAVRTRHRIEKARTIIQSVFADEEGDWRVHFSCKPCTGSLFSKEPRGMTTLESIAKFAAYCSRLRFTPAQARTILSEGCLPNRKQSSHTHHYQWAEARCANTRKVRMTWERCRGSLYSRKFDGAE